MFRIAPIGGQPLRAIPCIINSLTTNNPKNVGTNFESGTHPLSSYHPVRLCSRKWLGPLAHCRGVIEKGMRGGILAGDFPQFNLRQNNRSSYFSWTSELACRLP